MKSLAPFSKVWLSLSRFSRTSLLVDKFLCRTCVMNFMKIRQTVQSLTVGPTATDGSTWSAHKAFYLTSSRTSYNEGDSLCDAMCNKQPDLHCNTVLVCLTVQSVLQSCRGLVTCNAAKPRNSILKFCLLVHNRSGWNSKFLQNAVIQLQNHTASYATRPEEMSVAWTQ